MRRLPIATVMMLTAVMLAVPTPSPAAPVKVEICHLAKSVAKYMLMAVPGTALDRHFEHGDGMINDPVPDMDGYVFGSDCAPLLVDFDGDGVPNLEDNCPFVANADQSDRYGSAKGDACEDDSDGNGILDAAETDICVSVNGVPIVGPRGAVRECYTTDSPGADPNIAVAHGANSYAWANGENNTAIAMNGGFAVVYGGSNNTATSTGRYTWISYGDNNSATNCVLEEVSNQTCEAP